MGFLGKLFGSEKAIGKTAKGIYQGIDAVFFTDEEKSRYFINLLNAYEPFKLAQRLLALLVGIPYIFIWCVCVALFVTDAFIPQDLNLKINNLAQLNNDTLGLPFSIILSFYFGGGAIEGILRVKKKHD